MNNSLNSELDGSTSRYPVLWALLLSGLCLGYFYLLDNVIFSSARFSTIFRFLLVEYDRQYAWLAAAACIFAVLLKESRSILEIVDFLGRRPLAIALTAMIVLAVCSIFVYHNRALSMDEYAPVFQSKIFAAWRISARLPPQLVDWLVVPGFNERFLVASSATGEVIEAYWPGFALLLAPFQMLGIGWLCNPCVAAISLYLIYRIVYDISRDRRAAGFALLFAIASGAFVANAISFYSMSAHLMANLLFAWLLLKPSRIRAFAAGLTGSLALVLHNPYPHVLFALPWIIALGSCREHRKHFPYLVLGYLPLSLALGVGWLMVRSSIHSSLNVIPTFSSTVSGVFRWPDAAAVNMRVAALVKMWVWAVPGLFIFAAVGFVRHRAEQSVRLLLQSAILTFVGYMFVSFDQGHGWGYRYFHSAWGVIPVLAGLAMTVPKEQTGRLTSFAGVAAILSLIIIVPYQLSRIDQFISSNLAQLPCVKRPGNNVFFISPRRGFYLADLIQMDPLLREPDLFFASNGSALDEKFIHRYWPGAVNIYHGDTVQQWYLGDIDQRHVDPTAGNVTRFIFETETERSPK
jgi:hypothetical protein